MLYDIEKIKEEILPVNVCDHFGIPYIQRGNRKFISCPDHMKNLGVEDKHIGNCILGDNFKNAYYCFACNARGNVFDFIASINNLDIKSDFHKIVNLAAECLGDETEFQIENTDEYEKSKKELRKNLENKIKLSDKELQILNFNNTFIETVTECFSDKIDDKLKKDINFNNLSGNGLSEINYLDQKTTSITITNLMVKNYDLYCKLVKDKCEFLLNDLKKKILKDYNYIWKKIGNNDERQYHYFIDKILYQYKMKFLNVKEIYFKFLTDEERSSVDVSWLFNK